MVRGRYPQSYARPSRRGETILPPVMPAPTAMECQNCPPKGTIAVSGQTRQKPLWNPLALYGPKPWRLIVISRRDPLSDCHSGLTCAED